MACIVQLTKTMTNVRFVPLFHSRTLQGKGYSMRPGECNKHGQELLEKVDLPSRSHPYARLWRMRCTTCDSVYGCNSCDANLRRCPFCQDGRPPEPLPEDLLGLVQGTQAPSTTRVRRRAAVQWPSTDPPNPPVVWKGDSQATLFDDYIMVDWNSTNGALLTTLLTDLHRGGGTSKVF